MTSGLMLLYDGIGEIMRKLPKAIKTLVEGKNWQKDEVGESHSSVYLYDDYVLKIGEINQENNREYEILSWLSDKLDVPRVILFEKTRKKTYLLMSKIEGKPAFKLPYEEAIQLACEGLRRLWMIDTSTFPYLNSKKDALDFVKNNVELHEKELMEYADKKTYQNSPFKNPKELYSWIEENYPDKEKTVFSHGDYFLPNIIIKDHHIAGFIDFGLAGLYPKERDIAQLIKSLQYNYKNETRHHELISRHLDPGIDWDLVEYFKLYDELV